MVANMFFTLTLLAALGCGLMAGIFFVFSNSIMHALAQLQSQQGISVMQAINKTILNPLFFVVLLGTAAICILLAVSLPWRWYQPEAAYLLSGSLLYLIGAMLVTIVFNVPMNKSLETIKPGSIEAADMWTSYLTSWTAWNHVRSVAALLAATFFILALPG
jgi:uncharacterized membrane protein